MADPGAWQFAMLRKDTSKLTYKTCLYNFQEDLPTQSSVVAPVSTPLMFSPLGGPFNVHLVEIVAADGSVIHESPVYFVVAYPIGITDIRTVVLFAHPAPDAAYNDADYIGQNGGWNAILRYGRYFGNQISAAKKNLIFIMPVFSKSTFTSLGIFPLNWKIMLTGVLSRVQNEIWPDQGGKPVPRYPQNADRIIIVYFSLGKQVARSMMSAAGLQSYVVEIWDLDGVPSSQSPIRLPGKSTFYYNQASSGIGFHVPLERWSGFNNYIGLKKRQAEMVARNDNAGVIHGEIVQRLAYHAAVCSSFG